MEQISVVLLADEALNSTLSVPVDPIDHPERLGVDHVFVLGDYELDYPDDQYGAHS